MSSHEFRLAPTPPAGRPRELWIQHAAGFILFEDVRGYARKRVSPELSTEAREAAYRAIDDAVYGLMMVIDGVSGCLRDGKRKITLDMSVKLQDGETTTLRLFEGDGMCMGYHGWREGDFGEDPVVAPT